MLRRLPPIVAVATLATGVTLAFAFPAFRDGPLPGFTGAPSIGGLPEESNCTACHQGNKARLNLPGGAIHILDLPESFNPGLTYRMRVRLESDSTAQFPDRRWGFSITAVSLLTGDGVGTFSVRPDSLRIQIADPFDPWPTRTYVSHNENGYHQGDSGPIEWSLDWTAPPGTTAPVRFYAAGNAANGDNSPGDFDFIYTTGDSMADTTTSVRTASWGTLKTRYRK